MRNSNPMRNKAAVGLRAKPMPATATTLVKAVWHGYFFGGRRPQSEEEAAGRGEWRRSEGGLAGRRSSPGDAADLPGAAHPLPLSSPLFCLPSVPLPLPSPLHSTRCCRPRQQHSPPPPTASPH